MGSCSSKVSDSELNSFRHSRSMPDLSDSAKVIVDSTHRYDEDMVAALKKELLEEPQVFLLNNLLLSVMFFECYDKEIAKLSNATSKQEKELNLKLINEEAKQCIMPDAIFDIVNKHVRYRPMHGEKKLKSEPLAPQRTFVIHDNVEVLEPEDTAHYSGIDKPNYRVRTEVSSKPGFVKLRQIEQLNSSSSSSGIRTPSSTSSESPKSSQMESRVSYVKEDNDILDMPSTSSGLRSGESSDSYDYTTINQLNTPQPLSAADAKLLRKNHSLPHNCFTTIQVKNLEELQEPLSDDEDNYVERKKKNKIDLFKDVTYINSKAFMSYVAHTVFPNGLGTALGFNVTSVKTAKTIPGLIFCDSDDNSSVTKKHIIPSVMIQWPAALAFEWSMRDDRPTIIDRRTTLRYKWPTDTMINEIKKLPCVVIPKGCVPKRGENKDSSIEWEVAFPKAEKYIETKMSHAQMRCFLFITALHKTFIEPKTAYHGLLIEHIRTLMYWECEANYPNWPENRLGKKLLRVLRSLYFKLGKVHMSDYFIRDKNVFANIPGKYLRAAQSTIHRVIEQPVMYFLVTLRNLRYTSGRFYPTLDFKKLHNILVTDGIKTANPLLYKFIEHDNEPVKRKPRNYDPEAEWRKRHQQEIKKKFEMKEKAKKQQEENLEAERRESVDSVDLQWLPGKNFDVFKQRALLMFFMDHFIEMARKSLKLATSKQGLFYLRHTWYLSRLLEETDGCYPDAMEYQDRIKKEEEAAKRIAANEVSVPIIPKRNSFHINGNDAVQQVRGNTVHLSNLSRAYDSGFQNDVPRRKLKKHYNSRKVISEIHETTNGVENVNDRRKTISFSADVHTIGD